MIVTKQFSWHMGHRLIGSYVGKCSNLHGHTYRCEVAIESDSLDKAGMVVDFERIKELMRNWVDSKLDHGVIVSKNDIKLLQFLTTEGSKLFVLNQPNTTVELIAEHLFAVFHHKLFEVQLPNKPALKYVRVWETETSSATEEA